MILGIKVDSVQQSDQELPIAGNIMLMRCPKSLYFVWHTWLYIRWYYIQPLGFANQITGQITSLIATKILYIHTLVLALRKPLQHPIQKVAMVTSMLKVLS